MYVHKVPIHLETEDTFLFHLTMRQCVIVAVGCTVAYTSFINILTMIPSAALGLMFGLVAAFLLVICAVLLAFVKILNRGLEEWAMILLAYMAQPRLYLWRFARPDAFEQFDQAQRDRRPARLELEEDTW